MHHLLRCLTFVFLLTFIACKTEKPCSGLNPEIGKYNTPKKMHKGKKSLHSGPEKAAYQHRKDEMKRRKKGGGKTGGIKHGILGIHFSGGGHKSSGGGGNESQQKN